MALPVAFLHEEIKGHAVESQRCQRVQLVRESDSFLWPILWRNKSKAAWVMQEQDHGKFVREYVEHAR